MGFTEVIVILLIIGFAVWLMRSTGVIDPLFQKIIVGFIILFILLWTLHAFTGVGSRFWR